MRERESGVSEHASITTRPPHRCAICTHANVNVKCAAPGMWVPLVPETAKYEVY